VGLKRVLPTAPWRAQFAMKLTPNEMSDPKRCHGKWARRVGTRRRRRYPFFLLMLSGWSSCAVTVSQAFVEPLGPSTPAKWNSGVLSCYKQWELQKQ
jgi:hypothetical protein